MSNSLASYQTAPSTLAGLPPEIILAIFESLNSLECVLSTVTTCRSLYQIFRSKNTAVIHSVFSNIFHTASQQISEDQPEKAPCLIIHGLLFGIRKALFPTTVILEIFQEAWMFLERPTHKELLIPIGISLAWVVQKNGCLQEARGLLDYIFDGLGGETSPLTLLPLVEIRRKLMNKRSLDEVLDNDMDSILPNLTLKIQNLPVAVITHDGIFYLRSDISLQKGMVLWKHFILMRISAVPPNQKVYAEQDREVKSMVKKFRQHLSTL